MRHHLRLLVFKLPMMVTHVLRLPCSHVKPHRFVHRKDVLSVDPSVVTATAGGKLSHVLLLLMLRESILIIFIISVLTLLLT